MGKGRYLSEPVEIPAGPSRQESETTYDSGDVLGLIIRWLLFVLCIGMFIHILRHKCPDPEIIIRYGTIKELQTWAGVEPDGKFRKLSQDAYELRLANEYGIHYYKETPNGSE